MKTGRLLLALQLLVLVGCAPVITVSKMGNEYVQDAHSRNWWGPNWQRVTYCWKLDNGFCPKEDTRVETVSSIGLESPGQKMAVGAATMAPLGLGLGLGLAYQHVGRMTQSVTGQQSQAVKTNFESPGAVIK